MTLVAYIKRRLAERKLQRIVDETRDRFETRDYAKRRAAALKYTRREVAR